MLLLSESSPSFHPIYPIDPSLHLIDLSHWSIHTFHQSINPSIHPYHPPNHIHPSIPLYPSVLLNPDRPINPPIYPNNPSMLSSTLTVHPSIKLSIHPPYPSILSVPFRPSRLIDPIILIPSFTHSPCSWRSRESNTTPCLLCPWGDLVCAIKTSFL